MCEGPEDNIKHYSFSTQCIMFWFWFFVVLCVCVFNEYVHMSAGTHVSPKESVRSPESGVTSSYELQT